MSSDIQRLYRDLEFLLRSNKAAQSDAIKRYSLNTFHLAIAPDGALTVDLRGRVSFRSSLSWGTDYPLSSFSPVKPGAPKEAIDQTTSELVQRAEAIAQDLLMADMSQIEVIIKRERLLVSPVPNAAPLYCDGRILIRLQIPHSDNYFQIMFEPTGQVSRFDCFIQKDKLKPKYAGVFKVAEAIKPSNQYKKFAECEKALTLGTFYSSKENRFPIATRSWSGEPFLEPKLKCNPFVKDIVPYPKSQDKLENYLGSDAYKWWAYYWWDLYGRVGAFRGNCVSKSQNLWTSDNQSVLSRDLMSYGLQEGLPEKTAYFELPSGQEGYFPQGVNLNMKAGFFDDLEKCNVAYIYTHGGPINGILQLQPALDLWVTIFPLSGGLGKGCLRHLLIEACGTFTFFHPKDKECDHLLSTWVEKARLEGLVTVSGVDGGHGGLDRNGWRFFGYYNKYESICDSWAFSMLDEDANLLPVTAAYAETPEEAIKTLLFGRFTLKPAENKWIAVSTWCPSHRYKGRITNLSIDPMYNNKE